MIKKPESLEEADKCLRLEIQQKESIREKLNIIKEYKEDAEKKIGLILDDFRYCTGIYPSSLNLGNYCIDGKVLLGINIKI